jgi:hypothetical protein
MRETSSPFSIVYRLSKTSKVANMHRTRICAFCQFMFVVLVVLHVNLPAFLVPSPHQTSLSPPLLKQQQQPQLGLLGGSWL